MKNPNFLKRAYKQHFDKTLTPRFLTEEDKEGFVPESTLEKIIDWMRCPVCMDIMMKPVNVKNCLHKFCHSCLERYNRTSKKECPQCRK